MEKPGFILGRVFEPLLRFSLYLFYKSEKYSCLRIGTLTFWGDQNFLETCATSVERLLEIDSDLHFRITTKYRLDFYYDPKRYRQVEYAWIFGLSDVCLSWRAEGIIARLVYAFYLADLLPRRAIPKATRSTLQSHALATTSKWLDLHGFPEVLVNTFKKA